MESSESFLSDHKTSVYATAKALTSQSDSVQKGVGKPCRKQYLTISDCQGAALTLLCFAVAICSVQDKRIAAYLGLKYQLVVLGSALMIMSFTTSKQAQMFLIALEAHFGGSILQHYDAILRNDGFHSQIHPLLRLALNLLSLLPLGLSVSYKIFSGGGSSTTSYSIADTPQLQFGISGPPGLHLGNGIPGYINATSPLYNNDPGPRTQPPEFPSSHGFAMHVINATHTVMLDSPLAFEFANIQASLRDGEVQRLSALVNATYASLNSTPASPELTDFDDYWYNIAGRFWQNPQFHVSAGGGSWFGMYNGGIDMSLVFMSFYNETLNQNFESEANGFNLYRGTWLIASAGIFLEAASEFATSWSPETPHPEQLDFDNCNLSLALDRSQTLITCFWDPLSFKFYPTAGQYLTPSTDELSLWAASIAAMKWASLANFTTPAGGTGWNSGPTERDLDLIAQYPHLSYKAPYEMTSTVATMRRSFGLFVVLSVQPLFLVLLLIFRNLLHQSPVSENFGITTLLAGASRSSLDVLDGAAFSGKLTQKVRVQILVHDGDVTANGGVQKVEYVFDSMEKNSRLHNRKIGRPGYALLA